jgi:rod shape-determining protein MreB
MATILCPFTFPQLGTCRPGVNKKLEPDYSRTGEIEQDDFAFPADQIRIKVLETIEEEGEKVDLEGADIIVSGGRGLGGPEGFVTTIKPLADALGMGIDVSEPTGVMVVDMGADTTEISVLSLGGLVLSQLLPFGGNKLDESIVTYLKRRYNLLIGMKTAKALKESIGSAREPEALESQTIVGRDVVSGLPIEMEVTNQMVYEGIKDDLENIGSSIRMILEKVPPELAKDIVHAGIYLTGGSSRIKDIADYFSELTNITINVAEKGEETVALGLGQVLNEERYERYGYTMRSRIFS